jgi:hypothetical protein
MSEKSYQYEKFIAKLIKNIPTRKRNIKFLCPDAKLCKLMGKSGQKHQIDVAFIDKAFDQPKLVLIECKLKAPKYHIGPEVMKILWFNGEDLTKNSKYPKDYLLMVCSTSAFSSGAKTLANAFNIILEPVSFPPEDYTFKYEDIIQARLSSAVGFVDDASCTVCHVNGTED